jgi:hypothetical protein
MSLDTWLGGDDSLALAPRLSFGEIMDRLFALWIGDGSGRTFEEFCERPA